jgi:hypothetical protein
VLGSDVLQPVLSHRNVKQLDWLSKYARSAGGYAYEMASPIGPGSSMCRDFWDGFLGTFGWSGLGSGFRLR